MGRNTDEIKELILEIVKNNGKITLSDLLEAVNSRLKNNTIKEDDLNDLINRMSGQIKRSIQNPGDAEAVELASPAPTMPKSTTQSDIEKLPTGRVKLPKDSRK